MTIRIGADFEVQTVTVLENIGSQSIYSVRIGSDVDDARTGLRDCICVP